ncbi:hypothetical protein C8R45DRAFT_549034 [Mycena sanguinolenta]|nr:hypothetical protein C8R45DRAFT_549034 [Mycena sanguinolenta]
MLPLACAIESCSFGGLAPHSVGVLHPHSSSTSGPRCSFAIPPNGSPRRRGTVTLRRHRSCFRSPRLLISYPILPPVRCTLLLDPRLRLRQSRALQADPSVPLWRSSYYFPLHPIVWTWTRPCATAAAVLTASTGLRRPARRRPFTFHSQPSHLNQGPCPTTDDGRGILVLGLPSTLCAETLSIAGAVRFLCSKRRDGAFPRLIALLFRLRLRDHRTRTTSWFCPTRLPLYHILFDRQLLPPLLSNSASDGVPSWMQRQLRHAALATLRHASPASARTRTQVRARLSRGDLR